jgi:hypothetical protein
MTFTEFLKLLPIQNDITLAGFQNWAKIQTDLPGTSDPRELAQAFYKKLDHNTTAGFIKAVMIYTTMPNNELPETLLKDEDAMLRAINHIVELQHAERN